MKLKGCISIFIFFISILLVFNSCEKSITPLKSLSMLVDGNKVLVANHIQIGRGLMPSNIPPFGDGTHKINFIADFTDESFIFSITIPDVRLGEDSCQFYINKDKNSGKFSSVGMAFCMMNYNENTKIVKGSFRGKAIAIGTKEETTIEEGCFVIDLH